MRGWARWAISVLTMLVVLGPAAAAARGSGGWSYVLPIDHGIRADHSGRGHFLASRYHGRHNGVDLLAPVGTPTLAACRGRATAGRSRSFGRWVHLVCALPDRRKGGGRDYASLFYAHLSAQKVPRGRWVKVRPGQQLGAVGKSGNASSSKVMPHLHLELIVHGSRAAAMAERHAGRNQTSTSAAKRLMKRLQTNCVKPNKFHSRLALNRRRRADPFVTLSCFGARKPRFTKPTKKLRKWARRWSSHYRAKTFNVDTQRPPQQPRTAGAGKRTRHSR